MKILRCLLFCLLFATMTSSCKKDPEKKEVIVGVWQENKIEYEQYKDGVLAVSSIPDTPGVVRPVYSFYTTGQAQLVTSNTIYQTYHYNITGDDLNLFDGKDFDGDKHGLIIGTTTYHIKTLNNSTLILVNENNYTYQGANYRTLRTYTYSRVKQ